MDARFSEIVVEKPSKPKRRWFQFSLRTLLLIMLVCGGGLGLVAFERQKNAKYQDDVEAIQDLGGTVSFNGMPFRTIWLQSLLGNDSFRKVMSVQLTAINITDAELKKLKDLTQLQVLLLDHTKITDAGLIHLSGLTQLKRLNLNDTKITDAGLEHLKGLKLLAVLELHNTKNTEAGLADLKKALPNCDIER
jgi:hypothetical protein